MGSKDGIGKEMNWFDTAGFANLAKSAFSSAQKRIDRALDIHEEKTNDTSLAQLSEGDKFFASYGLSSHSESSSNNSDNNSTNQQVPPDSITKENRWSDWGSFFDSGVKEQQNKSPEHYSNKSVEENDKPTVFSQPQQSCVFPPGEESSAVEEILAESKIKEDECRLESNTKIDVHLTVTEMLTGLTPFLSETSANAQKPLEPNQKVFSPCDMSIEKDNAIARSEQKDSVHSISDDSSVCVSNMENNSVIVLPTLKDCKFTEKNSNELEFSCIANNNLEEWSLTDNIKCANNSSSENSSLQKDKDLDITSSSKSVISVSEDVLSIDSVVQQTELGDDRTFELLNDWAVPVSCDHRSEGSGDQTSIDTETKESENPELREYDIKSSDSLGSLETNSSCSFVKCSVGPSETCSTSDHSDQKFEYEHCSGHTSGEENETTTSSDIEIISSPNGENGERQSSNHLKHTWLSRVYGRRSESPNSDANFMPAVQEAEEDTHDQFLRSSLYTDRESSIDCEDDTEQSRKSMLVQAPDIKEYVQRQAELEEIVEKREKRLLKLTEEMLELYNMNSRFEREIKRLEEIRNKDSRSTSEMTQEFTQRIAQLENMLCEASKERDVAKDKLNTLEKETLSRPCLAEVEKTMKEKDQLIKELMDEGEKLSKQQLQHTSLIKKLRNKDKEKENILKSQKETLEEQSKELERLRRSLGAKDDQEKKHINTIRQLTIAVQQQETDLAVLRKSLENAVEETNNVKKSLDNSYRELAELHRSNAEKEIQAQEIVLSSEIAAKGELQQVLENMKKEAARERDTLLAQIEELQHSKVQIEQQAQSREEALQSEIVQIQQRLQESENRAEELSSQISSATLPLLRQIDNLQSMLVSRSASWEKSEENLSERLNELQNQALLSEEQEKLTQKNCDELSSKLSDICMQLSIVKQEKTQLASQLDLAQMKIAMLEENKSRECITVANVKQDLIEEINRLKLDKDDLSSQLISLQSELETEKQKVQQYEEQSQEKLKLRSDRSSNGTSSPTMSRLSSVSDTLHTWMQEHHSDGLMGMSSSTYNHTSLYESVRMGSASSILENFQSQLKQKDGEITLLQSEIFQLEKIRSSMGQELADISSQYEALKAELCESRQIKINFSDMEQKYNALLQMYGEKVEEAEELHLDLQDVKAMYRAQLDELLKKS